MHVLILGAAGMIGRKVTASLVAAGISGQPVDRLTLVDIMAPEPPDGLDASCLAADLAVAGTAARLIEHRPDVILHLAAVVSGEAESDFDKGYAVNFDGSRALLEAIRANEGYCPRVVFASSIAVFGAPFPDRIPDHWHAIPRSSYGTQKAMVELLVNDYSRRGFIDGISLRLPTICIRPGKPNLAASGFFSGILREPLNGQPAVLPVPDTVRNWFASPRAAAGFFLRAAGLDTARLGDDRAITLPGLSASVAEEIEALRRVAGQDAVNLIRSEPDPAVAALVKNWPHDFEAQRALALGFAAETTIDEIVQVYIEEDMPQA